MQLKGFLKRALPFFLTFSVGLLVASLFVTIAAPNFNFKKRNHRCREYRENYRLRMENQSLRQNNESLKRQLEDSELKTIPAFDLDVPPPPPPPRVKPNVKLVDPTSPGIIR
ncbi:MAG TPA: hypothetical protein VGB68_02150 [Pyrinomonadaceae bacterium]|jgi:hypothetical protein